MCILCGLHRYCILISPMEPRMCGREKSKCLKANENEKRSYKIIYFYVRVRNTEPVNTALLYSADDARNSWTKYLPLLILVLRPVPGSWLQRSGHLLQPVLVQSLESRQTGLPCKSRSHTHINHTILLIFSVLLITDGQFYLYTLYLKVCYSPSCCV